MAAQRPEFMKRTEMNTFKNPGKTPGFADRLSTAAHAKKALLEKFRGQPGVNDPAFAEREAARLAVRVARDARATERKAAREAQQAAETEARQAAQAALEAEQAALEAERKAARDARYAARKARKK